MNLADLKKMEETVMSDLKDFQRDTVERCFDLYRNGGKDGNRHRRILVADEVGLGKTLIARGLIAKLANLHWEEGDKLFKVVYICSNSAIARQNISKLKIDEKVTEGDVSDSRLSMQHVKIYEQDNDPEVRAGYIHLIPLTPTTSFNITRKNLGTMKERALMCAILRKLPDFDQYMKRLPSMMKGNVELKKFWELVRTEEERVRSCGEEYLSKISKDVKKFMKEKKGLEKELLDSCEASAMDNKVIRKLRALFAEISASWLEPDFVILDEFQRFREIISADSESDYGVLKNRFFKGKGNGVKTLLLSATPYKLYQTLEEAEEDRDGHYKEFLELMDFLHDNDEDKCRRFKEQWNGFSKSLSESLRKAKNDPGALDALVNNKGGAENAMYASGVCRTERLLIGSSNNIINDDNVKKALVISENDIIPYMEAEKIARACGMKEHIPVEYVKSCPYMLSFMMEGYAFANKLHGLKKKMPAIPFSAEARKILFVDKNQLQKFEPLPANNARLEKLMEVALGNGEEKLLWAPPSVPYYEFGGAFKGKDAFSKTLVFSAWAMVPRMIACTLSYECERMTIGKLYAKEDDKTGKGYVAAANKSRFPIYKLTTDAAEYALDKSSEILADAYNPLQYLGKPLSFIKGKVEEYIKENINALQNEYENKFPGRGDALIELYTNMAIASPAICALRIFRKDKNIEIDKAMRLAENFAYEIMGMFDTPEAVAVIELLYGRKSNDAHYKNVLKYCVDGNFAAMLDEYAHVLDETDAEKLCNKMCEALQANTASYSIDTHKSFDGDEDAKFRMRSHFAAAFLKVKIDGDKDGQRQDHLRTAFNSPFRPFVLATTSIGQEGLDFHNYARKVMHWNLPHNPIDIEQREGRINRYKCLAIRQSLAKKYCDDNDSFNKFKDKEDVWEEIFARALRDKEPGQPDLIPFWCLPDGEVKIERYVPMYPYSKDRAVYDRLLKILTLYRVTLGQPRQEELLEYLLDGSGDENIEELFINLSPFRRQA
jgi:hypothetical protein